MVLMIDANILLDVLQNHQPYVKSSSAIWKLCETEQAKGYVSSLTFANLVYIMRRELNAEKTEETLKKLSFIFQFTDLTSSGLLKASEMKWDDFEDALQSVTAERMNADFIITRNIKDFVKSKVTAFTPEELLARL